ncbi:MAG: DEAD/DEAH box helicase [Deltaproteobacteria bacterium]|nr:DEAD/DEAH box helicase [Deltaproteobacteria bacterium]
MTRGKTTYPRFKRPLTRRRPTAPHRTLFEKPRADPQLKRVLERIGVPEPIPFEPDPFQSEALEKVRTHDVLVSAPTGSGKTWIAAESAARCLSQGLKTWYASPLKALSNSIYRQFRSQFGSQQCGILTGDRKENPGAPIIVGTTEILRNQLYDAMHLGTGIQADLVILDEAHYLSDPDRGVVWEEVLIYLPPRVRLLLLSATISNPEEICAWLEKNRGIQTRVVRHSDRPVPLESLFLFPDGLIAPLGGRRGLNPRVKKFTASPSAGRGGKDPGRMDYGDLIGCLRALNLLPAIFFLKSRMDCNRALLTCASGTASKEKREQILKEVKPLLKKYPHLEGHRQMKHLLESRVGAHHAGQLPYWKVLIETMMDRGRLDAIFSTSTVAAGVNFPARTVVLLQSDRYNGRGFSELSATELHQMTGRAGRRGKDNIGFVLVVPGAYQDPRLIHELLDAPPEPLVSRIHINFSMTLNLLLSHRPPGVKELLERSFARFQEGLSETQTDRRWNDLLERLQGSLPEGRCDTGDPFEVMENIRRRSELRKRKRRQEQRLRQDRRIRALQARLTPGRLFLHRNRNIYVAFHTTEERGQLTCFAANIKSRVRIKRGRIRLRRVGPGQVKAVFDALIPLPEGGTPEELETAFRSFPTGNLDALPPIPEGEESPFGQERPDGERFRSVPCMDCPHAPICTASDRGEVGKVLKEIRMLSSQVGEGKGGLWLNFKRHLRFLKDAGYVDGEDRLTPDGVWASKLRLDHPLLIAEAIRRGGFDQVGPEVMAGCIAPFVWDRAQDLEVSVRSPLPLTELEDALERIVRGIEEIRTEKVRRGFENPSILFWPGVALFLWTKGVPWKDLLFFVPIDEGDMASLIMRCADHLRQVTNLEETHPELADAASRAIGLIMRDPVFID